MIYENKKMIIKCCKCDNKIIANPDISNSNWTKTVIVEQFGHCNNEITILYFCPNCSTV